jgi:single-strand DNA-binding protein
MGRLTRDPELKTTEGGTTIANFTLAVDRDYGKGEKKADFIPCVAWRDTATFVNKHLKKGSLIGLVGRLETRTWKDKEDKTRVVFEVNVGSVYFGEGKKSTAPSTSATSGFTDFRTDFYDMGDDDGGLPF